MKDEIWDIYDSNRKRTGMTHQRTAPFPAGYYHIVVHAWLQNSSGELLITKRAPNKSNPDMWECTGGAVLAGEDSIAAAIRELKEETGLCVNRENGKLIFEIIKNKFFSDIWLFRQDFDINDVILQENETTAAKCAAKEEILDMICGNKFIAYDYIPELFKKI